MFNIGSQEVLVILVLVFLLFGPKHIPEVAHGLGKGLGELRRVLQGVEDDMRRSIGPVAPPDPGVPREPSIAPPGTPRAAGSPASPAGDTAPGSRPGPSAAGPEAKAAPAPSVWAPMESPERPADEAETTGELPRSPAPGGGEAG